MEENLHPFYMLKLDGGLEVSFMLWSIYLLRNSSQTLLNTEVNSKMPALTGNQTAVVVQSTASHSIK
jgi:hypothetical protein